MNSEKQMNQGNEDVKKMLEKQEALIRNDDIVLRKIADKFYLVNIRDNYLDDTCRLYVINEIGNFIWKEFDSPTTPEAVADKLYESLSDRPEYAVVYKDVCDFTYSLISLGFLRSMEHG